MTGVIDGNVGIGRIGFVQMRADGHGVRAVKLGAPCFDPGQMQGIFPVYLDSDFPEYLEQARSLARP